MKLQFSLKVTQGQLLRLLVGTAWLVVVPVRAADFEENNTPFLETGRIHNVILAQDLIILEDRGFTLSPNIIIHAGDKTVPKAALKKGAAIGFNSATETTGLHRSVITEIWVLPSQ